MLKRHHIQKSEIWSSNASSTGPGGPIHAEYLSAPILKGEYIIRYRADTVEPSTDRSER